MRLKRILSLVIAFAMLVASVPAYFASAEDVYSLTYEFKSSSLSGSPTTIPDTIGSKSITGAAYAPLRYTDPNSTKVDGYIKYVTKSENKGAILFEIQVDEPGTYIPSVKYHTAARGGYLKTYIFDDASAFTNGSSATSEDGALISDLENLIPLDSTYIDTYATEDDLDNTVEHTYKNSVTFFEAGTYYLAFAADGARTDADTKPGKTMIYLSSFTLTKDPDLNGDNEIGDITKATDVGLDFSKPTCEPTSVTIDEYGWCINTVKSHATAMDATISEKGLYSKVKYAASERRKLAIDVYVPNDGVYQPKFSSSYGSSNARLANVYCDEMFIGAHDYGSDGMQTSSLRAVYLEKGVHTFYFEALTSGKNDKYYHTLTTLSLIAKPDFAYPVEINTSSDTYHMAPGTKTPLNTKVQMSDGFYFLNEKTFSGKADPITYIEYSSSNTDVAEVTESGEIFAVAEGEAVISVKATSNGESVLKEIPVLVDENCITQVEIKADSFVMPLDSDGILLGIVGKTASGDEARDMESATTVWKSSDETIVSVDENGLAKPVGTGSAKVELAVSLKGVELTASAFVSVREGKAGRSFYTDEKVEAARENIEKYSWAKSKRDSAVRAAEKYLGLEEMLWNLVPGQGIPRSTSVGYKSDPAMHYCRYCGDYLYDEYGRWGYKVDPLENPWKIQCRTCLRLFPSNDFESFYKLGLDEHGNFNRELALQKNAELVAKGEDGYLVNTLYPELYDPTKASYNKDPRTGDTVDGRTWGVDDGMGYDTGRVYGSNNLSEVHTYIAYYTHVGLWYMNGDDKPVVTDALESLANAYIYTGDIKYGRVGAILLDRVADYYPDYSMVPYLTQSNNKGSKGIFYVSSGGHKAGKIIGSIWENGIADRLSLAYDAFFPAYDDPYVVEFLSEKAKKYNLENTKKNPELIRQNIEDGILREIFEGAKDAQIYGNFGSVQATVASCAVVLDTQPDTNEMIDWIFAKSNTDEETYNTGGGVNTKLITHVSRDGQGDESAPGYNKIWITELSDAASKLAGYDGYDGMNLYEHPKYLRMIKSYPELTIVRRGVPPIGDSSSAANYSKLPNDDAVMINAFAQTKDVEIAQHFYKMSDADFQTIHYDIFTKNPESLQDDIKAVIDEYGEYNYDKSSMLTGYGFGALRAGTLSESGEIRDTQRDFWMYFGGAESHSNYDKLHLGVEAYGIPFTTDLGYPEATGSNPNKHQWASTTLAHNAVVVNEKNQHQFSYNQKPLHFDATDTRVKVMEVDATPVYDETKEYKRTVVMVDYDDEVSYGIDFFKVRGGDDHIYSFHANSVTTPETSENLSFVHQETGTYAGADVPFGNDPWTNESDASTELKYPKGYTWLEDIYKAEKPGESEFWFDFEIEDFRNFSRNDEQDYRLRMTALNDFEADEVTLANGKPPRTTSNSRVDHLEYMLIRRKGENLNSLFTTVVEPYIGERYIKSIESIEISVDESSEVQPGKKESAKAVKVELIDGRCDYIVYAQNNQVTYDVGGVFKFKGFVGVWTVNSNGANVYSYVNDGEMIGNDDKKVENLTPEITGTIVDFQKELSFDNWVEVELNREISQVEAEDLSDRLMNIENPEKLGNSSFIVKKATMKSPTRVLLDLGEITLIDGFLNPEDESQGYSYDAAVDRKITIPMSYEEKVESDEVSDKFGTKGAYIRNLTTTIGNTEYCQVYLFSGIDHLNYAEVGFEVKVNGRTNKMATFDAFETVAAKNATITASDIGPKCTKIFAYNVIFPTSYKDKSITYRAYAVDKEGNTIYGKYVTIDKIYNK